MKIADNKTRDILLVFFLVLAGMFFRRYDAFTNPQLWAEDGRIFLMECEQSGIRSFLIPYAGYLHLVPRAVAWFYSILSVNYSYIPLCYNLSSLFISFLVAAQLYKSGAYMGLNHKVFYAVIFVFLPLGPEVFMNITNIIWITALYLVDFLFIGYQYYGSEKNKAMKLCLIILISLTGPYSLLLSPLVILILFLERKTISRIQFLPMAMILAGGLIQLWCIIHSVKGFNRTTVIQPENFHLWKLIQYNISDLAFMRSGLLPGLPESVVVVICMLLFLLLVYALFVIYRKITFQRKYVLPLTALLFLGSFIYAFWPMESYTIAFAIPRYYFVPYTCVAWLLIIGLDKQIRTRDLMYYTIYFMLQSKNLRNEIPDYHWKDQVKEYYEGKRKVIEINPDGWEVALPARGKK